jgi:indolepyruvate ferredoxin oxidoreductase beta subunit
MASFVFAGVGGQGIITVAIILGRAAVIEGKPVLMTELHGMAQRGGKISVEVRLGDYKSAIIPSKTADAMVAFEELEAVRNISKLKEGGIILLNRRRIHPVSLTIRQQNYPDQIVESELKKYATVSVEADTTALELGNKRVANTVMVGALFATGLLGLDEESMIAAIKESLPERHWEVNLKAFEEGKRLVLEQSAKAV